ncbi:WAT1-related protein At5g07050-like isoform X1 [Fagus crenata]
MEVTRLLMLGFEFSKPYLFLTLNELFLAVFMILVETVTSSGISALVIVVYEHDIATILLSFLAFFLENIHLPKRWTELDPLPSICNGPHFPSKKCQMLEHQRAGQDMGSSTLGCRSIDYSVVEGASCTKLCCSTFNQPVMGYVIQFYPTELSLSAMMSLFGTIQTAIVSVCVVSWSSWDLKWEKGLVLVTILLGGIFVTGLSYYVMTWSIKKKGPVFTLAFDPLLVVVSFFLQTFFLGNSAHLGSIVGAVSVILGMYLLLWAKANDMEKKGIVTDDSVYSPFIQS